MTRKIFLTLMLFIFCTALSYAKEEQTSSITVKYRYAADAFYLMDQVSEAIPVFFLVKDYRQSWEKQYGISDVDEKYFQKYKKIREKYRDIPEHVGFGIGAQIAEYPSDLFGPAENDFIDPIATVFYQSESLDQAFDTLDISSEDSFFIKEFYSYFAEKINKLIGSSNTSSVTLIQKANNFLHQEFVVKHLESIRVFYNSIPSDYQALILWRPEGGGFCASFYNGYLLIQLSPEILPMLESDSESFSDLFMTYIGVVIHEATHGFSGNQNTEQKLRLTEKYLEGSGPLEDVFNIWYLGEFNFLEEPLVQILSQALFFKKYYPEFFDLEDNAYGHPLVKHYLPFVEAYFNNKQSIDDDLVLQLGHAYRDSKDTCLLSSLDDICALFAKNVYDIKAKKNRAFVQAQKVLAAIEGVNSTDRTFDNTVRAFDKIEDQFEIVVGSLDVIQNLHPDDSMRTSAHHAVVEMKEFSIDAFFNKAVYKAFKAYKDNAYQTELLGDEERYYFQNKMQSFSRHGFDLPEEQFEELKRVKKEISQLELEFQKNINDDKSFIIASRDELSGCRDVFINQLKPDETGHYILTCDGFTVHEILNYCTVAKTRKNLWEMFNNRAYPTNRAVLEALIAKRGELAEKLGFDSYTAFDLDDQMIETPDRAKDFVEDLHKKVSPKVELEFAQLCSDLPEGVLVEDGKLDLWNLGYASAYYKQKHFKLDEREIAQYFPLEATVEGLFSVYQKFLDLEFKKVSPDGVWDDVFAVEICKRGNSQPLAYVFFDIYSRANKFPSACASKVVSASKLQRPSAYFLIANFPKPSKSTPTLLRHDEVVTLFHEFGHVMHAILGQTEMAGFAGTAVKRDFVEVPSMLFEQWAWDAAILQMISSHYETKKPLPKTLIDQLVELKQFDSGNLIQQQCVLSLLSLDLFSGSLQRDLDGIFQDYEKYFPHIRYNSAEHFYASWVHIAQSRYGAKYYGYLWSRMLAHDIFATIKKYGVLNPKMGKKLTDTILGKGGSKDPNMLLVDFLGREPNNKAFINDIGVR